MYLNMNLLDAWIDSLLKGKLAKIFSSNLTVLQFDDNFPFFSFKTKAVFRSDQVYF
jgi:hypothetical protein